MATEHLIRTGYKSVGYVQIGAKDILSDVRKNGYSRALSEFDIPYDPDFIFTLDPVNGGIGVDRFQLGVQFGKEFKAAARKPEALFFYNDMSAIGFIQGAAEAGLHVPDDIAIVGFDDTTVARFAPVPLTTIHQPVDTIGRMAVEIIQKRIQRIAMGNRTVLKPLLVVRDSCGAKKRAGGQSSVPELSHTS